MSNMNKLHAHGGLSKPPLVNQLVGQQPQQHPSAPNSIAHMGESLQWVWSDQITWSVFQTSLLKREPFFYAITGQLLCAFLLLVFHWPSLLFLQVQTCSTTTTTCRPTVIWTVATAVRLCLLPTAARPLRITLTPASSGTSPSIDTSTLLSCKRPADNQMHLF